VVITWFDSEDPCSIISFIHKIIVIPFIHKIIVIPFIHKIIVIPFIHKIIVIPFIHKIIVIPFIHTIHSNKKSILKNLVDHFFLCSFAGFNYTHLACNKFMVLLIFKFEYHFLHTKAGVSTERNLVDTLFIV
jgi:hypothetical protein